MNVTELARRLKVPTKELLEILPTVGFDIGRRAIKVDDRQAHRIIDQWPRLLSRYRELTASSKVEPEAVAIADAAPRQIALPPLTRVKDFAEKLKLPASKVIAVLMKNGVLSSVNEQIDFDTASIVASELGFEVITDTATASDAEESTASKMEQLLASNDTKKLQSRAPVVVIMGHVDHGKTKLLDTIRQTNVVAGESGGITQHIGAYQVVKKNHPITFIDTPGHEAFTTMRSRGARVADIAILVIAADDSIQPQTKESIKIIKSAELPMIVAINKVDKPDANIEKVKQDLAQLDLIPEDWGGKTICVPLSAKTGAGIDELLEMILLVAETEKDTIVANPSRSAAGTIIESHVNPGEGPVATVLIQNGTLKRGDLAEVSGTFYGKIRAMKDFTGRDIDAAPPSMPVKILGLKAAPSVGDILEVTTDAGKRQKVKKYQLVQQATDYSRPNEPVSGDRADVKSVNVILKADVLGSLEAIIASLQKFEHPEVAVNIISKGLGNITENDVDHAQSANAVILGFKVKPAPGVETLSKDRKVDMLTYDVIYKLFDEVRRRLEQLLQPEVIRTELGRLKVLAVFRKEDRAAVIGGTVVKGKITMNAKVSISRDEQVLGTGTIVQLQSNKVNVNDVSQGHECGLKVEGKTAIAVGDYLDVYIEATKEKKLGSLA